MMYPGSLWTRLGQFNSSVCRREAAEFLLLFVLLGYDEAFFGCCGLRGELVDVHGRMFLYHCDCRWIDRFLHVQCDFGTCGKHNPTLSASS